MEKKVHPDQKYIVALLNNDYKVLSELYSKFSKKIINYIKNNNGSETEAHDIIQETLIVIFNQAKEKNLILTCPFDAYFYLLCKRKWLNILNKKKIKKVTILEDITSITDEQEELVIATELHEQKASLIEKKLIELGGKCKELLELNFKIKSMQEVAKILNVSYGYARKKKSECIGKLSEMVKNSSIYKSITPN